MNVQGRKAKGEVVGGGWFVFRRGRTSGRIKPARFGKPGTSWYPFEHASEESAKAEAERLAVLNPGLRFCVFHQVSEAPVTEPNTAAGQAVQTSAEAA